MRSGRRRRQKKRFKRVFRLRRPRPSQMVARVGAGRYSQ
ncbi:unnamed protein product [Ascophyllum nodosum]